MYLHSIDGIHHLIKQTPYYKGKRPSEKPVFIDKCNLFLNWIYEGNRHNWELSQYKPVPLHRNILRNQLGRHENEIIIKILQELNIIEVNQGYTSALFAAKLSKTTGTKINPVSKQYGISQAMKNGGKIIKVGVISQRMEKKLRAYKSKVIKGYCSQPMHRQIIDNLIELKFIPGTKKVLEALLKPEPGTEKDIYFREAFNQLQELNEYTDITDYIDSPHFYYTQSKKVGRVFHYFATIPKGFRESLKLKDGTPLAEIDLKNSQPLIIALNYLQANDGKLNKSDGMLLNDVMDGNFYKRVAEQARKNNDEEMYNLFEQNYSKFKAVVLGQGLYFNYLPLTAIKPVERYLIQLYPYFMHYVRELKRLQGYKYISQQAQAIESRIFIDNIFTLDNNLFAVPVHDSLLVRCDEVKEILSKLVRSFLDTFSFLDSDQARELFRITYFNYETATNE